MTLVIVAILALSVALGIGGLWLRSARDRAELRSLVFAAGELLDQIDALEIDPSYEGVRMFYARRRLERLVGRVKA